jgi:hypothetical protein
VAQPLDKENVDTRGRRRDDVSLKEYVDGTVGPWTARMVEGDVTLREYVEEMFRRDHVAVQVASEEREKAARALREDLARTIADGDQALRDHVASQIEQIRAALAAANTLEVARITGVTDASIARYTSLRSEVNLINQASETAIAKAEDATDKRFQSVNEFRAQLSDVIGRFLPREVADAQIAEMRLAISALTARVDRASGSHEGKAEARVVATSSAQVAIATLGLLVAVLSIAVVVILANGAGP